MNPTAGRAVRPAAWPNGWTGGTRPVNRRALGLFVAIAVGVHVGLVLSVPAQTHSHTHPQTRSQTGIETDPPGVRAIPLPVRSDGRAGFVEISGPAVGIQFVNTLSHAGASANINYLNGSGVALGDVDGDGWCDVYFCNKEGNNALFRNRGDWRFEEVTRTFGLECADTVSMGAVFADFNGDDRLDLFVSANGSPNLCFINRGEEPFERIVLDTGIHVRAGSNTIAVGDVDGNGTLDVYVANGGEDSILRGGGKINVGVDRDGNPVVRGRHRNRVRFVGSVMVEVGEPDVLYLNDGQAGFTTVPLRDGRFRDPRGEPIEPWLRDVSLAAMFRDINGDLAPDLYVCADFQTPDRLWLNQGNGSFRLSDREALRATSYNSMGIDFADIDRDGLDDFIVVDMLSPSHPLRMTQSSPGSPGIEFTGEPAPDRPQIRRNTLFVNRGNGTFAETAYYSGVAASDWSWAPAFLDVDLDGYEDLLIVNGTARDMTDLDAIEMKDQRTGAAAHSETNRLAQFPALRTPNLALRNRGDLTFEEASDRWGFRSVEACHGMAFGDLDNDGDLDVVLNPLNTPPLLYRNRGFAPRLAIQLDGLPPNTAGIGSRIEVRGGAVPLQTQEMIAGGRYLSGDQALRTFAAGNGTGPMSLRIRWRGGQVTDVPEAKPNHLYALSEPELAPAPDSESGSRFEESAIPVPLERKRQSTEPTHAPATAPWFVEPTGLLSHRHREAVFDDHSRQPSLNRRLSRSGPVLAWLDVDSDGDDDLLVGAGKGGKVAVFTNRGGAFERHPGLETVAPTQGDITAIVPWFSPDGRPAVLMGETNYEAPPGTPSRLVIWTFDEGRIRESALDIPDPSVAIGPIAAADWDGDGDLDLFVGGRCVPGEYPRTAPSWLFRSGPGGLSPDPQSDRLFLDTGPASDARWTDVTGDGLPELILACEWDAIRLFENRDGRLHETTEAWGLRSMPGLWQSVTSADFDGDGRTDLAAGNRGLNTAYQLYNEHAVYLYYTKGLDADRVDLIEAYRAAHSGEVLPVRNLSVLRAVLPGLTGAFPTHRSFMAATMDDLVESSGTLFQRRECSTWVSAVFLNRDGRFEMVPLPGPAQWTPVFGLCAADFDGDGRVDLFLAQNDGVPPEGGEPLNAGLGLLLRGDGDGQFTAISASDSGLSLWGNQRGVAAADYDRDGRVDLVVGQNQGETRLFRNEGRGGRRALTFRVNGGPGNPAGLGTRLQLVFADGTVGPVHEVHGGSGYGSVNGLACWIAAPNRPTAVRLRRPGQASREIALEFDKSIGGYQIDQLNQLTPTPR